MVREMQRLAEEVGDTLRSRGFRIGFLEYPVGERKSIDIIARRGPEKLLIKVSYEVDNVGQKEAYELTAISSVFGGLGLLIGRKTKKKELENFVVYERHGIPAITPETLEELVDREKIFVYADRGGYYVRVDGRKLRKKREEMNMSLGDLAYLLGVSRKAVYEYERSKMNLSLTTALKLIEIFGEEILAPLNIDELREREKTTIRKAKVTLRNAKLRRIVYELSKIGVGTVAATEKTPIDLAVKSEDELAIASKDNVSRPEHLGLKEESLETFSKILNVKSLIIDDLRKVIDILRNEFSRREWE